MHRPFLVISLALAAYPALAQGGAPPLETGYYVVPSTRPGVTLRVLVTVPAVTAAAAVLYEGGTGRIDDMPNGFLVRNVGTFAAQGVLTALVDAPSDYPDGIDVAYRLGPDQVTDAAAVLAWLAQNGVSLPWVAGMSYGSFSAVAVVIGLPGQFAGLGLFSALTTSSKPYLPPSGVLDQALDQITVPTVVLGHVDDACPGTPPAGVLQIVAALTGAQAVGMVVRGGLPPATPPCGPLAPHGFYGIDAEVVRLVSDLVKSKE